VSEVNNRPITSMQDAELIARARVGDRMAFEELVYRYDKQVLSIAARYVQSAEDAKDIYQEVFMRVYRALPKFELRSEFSTWLFRITTNVCLSHRSRRKRHTHSPLDGDADEDHGAPFAESIPGDEATDRSTEGAEIAQHIQEAVDRLSPKLKMAFVLKHYEGLKIKEIAKMMSCTEGTVKKYLFTATQKIRHELSEIFD